MDGTTIDGRGISKGAGVGDRKVSKNVIFTYSGATVSLANRADAYSNQTHTHNGLSSTYRLPKVLPS